MAKEKYYSVPKARDEFDRQKDKGKADAAKYALERIDEIKYDLRFAYSPSRELSLAITKLDEAAMWIERIDPKKNADKDATR